MVAERSSRRWWALALARALILLVDASVFQGAVIHLASAGAQGDVALWLGSAAVVAFVSRVPVAKFTEGVQCAQVVLSRALALTGAAALLLAAVAGSSVIPLAALWLAPASKRNDGQSAPSAPVRLP